MSCPPNDTLIAFAANDLDPIERERVQVHLAGRCAACQRELETVAALRRIAGSELLEDPPARVLSRAERIPQDARAGGLRALAGQVAALVFDTLRDPLPQGARSSAAQSRQMLFHALDYDIDVRIAPASEGRVRVSGQILPGPNRPIEAAANLEVALAGRDEHAVTTATNELGEFDFGSLDEDDYTLSVETDDERLLVESLPARSA